LFDNPKIQIFIDDDLKLRYNRYRQQMQKLDRRLSLAKLQSIPSALSQNTRYEPGMLEMIQDRLDEIEYNPRVNQRKKQQEKEMEENERMADYVNKLNLYGGKKTKKKRKYKKVKNKRKKGGKQKTRKKKSKKQVRLKG